MEVGHSIRMGKRGTETVEEPLQDTKISSSFTSSKVSQESQARQMQPVASCLKTRHCIVKEGRGSLH